MARKTPTLKLGEILPDQQRALENFMLKAALLASQVDAVLSLDQIKTPSVADKLRKALDDFMDA